MMRSNVFLSSLLACALSGACTSTEGAAPLPAQSAGDDGPPAAPQEPATADASSTSTRCTDVPLTLLVEESEGHLSRLFVEAELESKRVAFLFDTGSATTFLERPSGTKDPSPHVADVVIGTCSLPIDGRPYPNDERVDGLDVVGFLGADTLLGSPASELDLAGKKIIRRVKLPLDPDIASWPTVEIDIVQGHVLAHVVVEGQPLRLMVDTGSPHLLWIGRNGEPGDRELRTTDAEGTPLALYLGTAEVRLAPEVSARAPILRAPTFPYFEETARRLGGNVQGLIGLSALGRRRIVVDREAGVLRVRP